MNPEREAKFRQLQGRARELAQAFEERSLERYESGQFTYENIAELRASGITRMNVPASFGGLEATVGENVEIIRTIARGCGSAAFALANHLSLTGSLRAIAQEPARSSIYRVVTEGAFVCGGFTDAQSGGTWIIPSTRAVREGDDFKLNGTKHFVAGFDGCTHIVIAAELEEEHLQLPFNLVAFFTTKPPEATAHITSRWLGSTIPMTGSHSVQIRDLRVSADALASPEGLTPWLVMSQQHFHHYCTSAVFLGLADRAYSLAIEATRGRSNSSAASTANMPGVQFALGKMRCSLDSMEALLEHYCDDHNQPGEDLPAFVARSCIPKYLVCNEAQRVVRLACDVIGVTDIRENTRIGQIYRNVRAGALLPFSNDLCREFIGKNTLGLDPFAQPRWL